MYTVSVEAIDVQWLRHATEHFEYLERTILKGNHSSSYSMANTDARRASRTNLSKQHLEECIRHLQNAKSDTEKFAGLLLVSARFRYLKKDKFLLIVFGHR